MSHSDELARVRDFDTLDALRKAVIADFVVTEMVATAAARNLGLDVVFDEEEIRRDVTEYFDAVECGDVELLNDRQIVDIPLDVMQWRIEQDRTRERH